MTKDIRSKIFAVVSVILILGGFYGLHNDWTLYVWVCPFVWIICGCLIDFLVNGKESTGATGFISILLTFILGNIAMILIHNDKPFIIGRLLCSIGATILILDVAKNKSFPNVLP